MKNWFVLQTKPLKEFIVEKLFSQAGIPVYNPKILHDNGSARPLFPCYEFIFFDFPKQFSLVRYTRGVRKVVGNRLGPIPIGKEVIEEIRKREIDGFVQLEDVQEEPQPGDLIEVTAGPLQGFKGIFKKALNDQERVLILLNYVSYQGYLLIDKNKIKKAK